MRLTGNIYNMSSLYIILAAIVVVVVWIIFAYNGFVKLVTRAKEAWADIDVQLKRRYDLIPNLIEAVKGMSSTSVNAFEK